MLESIEVTRKKLEAQRVVVRMRTQIVEATDDTEADQNGYDEKLEKLDQAKRLLAKYEWQYQQQTETNETQ